MLTGALFQENVFLGNFQNDPEFVENWREDLARFASNYVTTFPEPFAKMSQEEFEASIDRLHNNIPSLSSQQIIVEFMKLVASIEDGHTWLLPQQAATGYRMLPLRVYHFSDGLFVTDADSGFQSMIGGKVIRIGDTGIEEITTALTPLVSHDNEMTILDRIAEYYLFPELLQALGFVENADQVSWTIQKMDGSTETFLISPISPDEYLDWIEPTPANPAIYPTPLPQREDALYLQRLKENFWMTHLEEPDVLYIQYNGIASTSVSESGTRTTVRLFSNRLGEFLDEHLETPVIVDIRHTFGGLGGASTSLLNVLTTHEAFNQPEKLFLILGRRTFSAAVVFADQLRAGANVTLVGEPSGGGVNFFAAARPIRLLNSQLTINISSSPIRSVRDDDLPWHAPDILANLSSTDFFNGHDPSLEAIFKHLISK